MYARTILAVSGLISAVAAVPMAQQHHHHHRREYVWETVTQEVIETIPVTKTIWLDPGESVPTENAQAVAPAAWNPPAASSPSPYKWTSSSYVPPVPSTSSEPVPSPIASSSYVAPTSSAAPIPPPTTSSYVAPPPPISTYTPPPPPTTTSTTPPPPVSTYVPPPTTSSSVYTPPAVPSSSAAPAPAPSASSGGNGITSGLAAGGTYYTGDITFYDVGLGACGLTSVPSDKVVAISESIFDAYAQGANPNDNALCGTTVTITNSTGATHQATIVDRCTGCADADLDLSYDFFGEVTNNDWGAGRIAGTKWCFD